MSMSIAKTKNPTKYLKYASVIGVFLGAAILLQIIKRPIDVSGGSQVRKVNDGEGPRIREVKSITHLDLPPYVKEVVLNIGSNRDPILPRASSGACAITIAFEPIIPELIPDHPQVMVVPAAVSDSSSLATMYKYNSDGVSSSLAKPAKDMFWNTGNKNLGVKIVPVVTMVDVLQSIPPNVTIDFIQTDAQGFDFLIIQAGIQEIQSRGVKFLKTEVYTDNVITYKGAKNDLCLHWIPFMTSHGYTLVGTTTVTADKVMVACERQEKESNPTAGLNEADALWKLSTVKETVDVSRFAYPLLRGPGSPPPFSTQDYEACTNLGK